MDFKLRHTPEKKDKRVVEEMKEGVQFTGNLGLFCVVYKKSSG